MMRKSLYCLLLAAAGLLPGVASAMSAGVHLDEMDPDLRDLPSLQRGWRTFMNYCHGCHSLEYQRYNRTARDLGVPEDVVQELLHFDGGKIGEHMVNAMPAETSSSWFGAAPPDLTMVARVRGPEWIYTYLRSFYRDASRPFGVNNTVLENAGMPHVLEKLQGVQVMTCAPRPMQGGHGGEARDPLNPETPVMDEECGVLEVLDGTGELTSEAYDQLIYDLVNFLVYTGEPMRLQRQTMGVYVLLFLVVMFVFAYLLNREYWKDVH